MMKHKKEQVIRGVCRECGGKYNERIDGKPPATVAILPWQTICYRCEGQEIRKREANADNMR